MIFTWIKPYLPRSLYGRAALILIVPILALQLIVGATFVRRHYAGVTKQMIDSLTPRLMQILDTLEDGTVEMAQKRAFENEFLLTLQPVGAPITQRGFWDISGYTIINHLHDNFPYYTCRNPKSSLAFASEHSKPDRTSLLHQYLH